MDIATKYSIGDTVYSFNRKKFSNECPTCKGNGKINVTNGTGNWIIECPDCKGKRKTHITVHYDVISGIIKGVIAQRGDDYSQTKYILDNGMHKNEKHLFADIKDAEEKCCLLNENIRKNERYD